MQQYERFDETPAEIKPSDMVDNQAGNSSTVGDVHIRMPREENGGEKQYIEDPAGTRFVRKSLVESLQAFVKSIIEHIAFRAITVLLILLDFIFVIVLLARNTCSSDDGIQIVSHLIISYFMLEVMARIFYMGRAFFHSWFDMIDMIVVVVSFTVDMVFVAIEAASSCTDNNYLRLVVIGRVVRIIRIGRIIYLVATQKRQVATASRHVVSSNKRRFHKDGFDLDLCYITERVIAMSFPSRGIMALYRNPIREVARFFDTKHKDHYRIYNLCSERDYDETLFHNRVERVYIDDHNVPLLKDMISYCDNVRQWMAEDKNNVIAVHCKGGKGRTGTMICTWLIDCGLFDEAQDSLDYFGDRRTDLSVGTQFQGVQTPSQSRYVGYYEKVKKTFGGSLPPSKKLKIQNMKIESMAGVGNGDGSDLTMEIRVDNHFLYECDLGKGINCQVMRYTDSDSIVVNIENCPVLEGDVKIRFFSTAKNIPKVYDKCAFFFWFYTSFIEENRLCLPRDELDNPHKTSAQKVYRDTFAVELNFQEVLYTL